jgi:hypothetical protein
MTFDPFDPAPVYRPEPAGRYAGDTRHAPGNITRRLARRDQVSTRALMAAPKGR